MRRIGLAVVAALLCGAASVPAQADGSTMQGSSAVGTGNGCASSPDCTAFVTACNSNVPAVTYVRLDVRPYRGRALSVRVSGSDVSTTPSGFTAELYAESCSRASSASGSAGAPVTMMVAPAVAYLVLTFPLGTSGTHWAVVIA